MPVPKVEALVPKVEVLVPKVEVPVRRLDKVAVQPKANPHKQPPRKVIRAMVRREGAHSGQKPLGANC